MAFSDVFDAIALIVGGTQPDATNQPYFYSGVQKGDGTGIAGIKGCYSAPPENVSCDVPFAVVLMGTGTDGSDFRGGSTLMYGENFPQDMIRLQICVGRTQPEYQYDKLMDFRDLVPATFAGKLQLNATATVLDAFPQDYKFAHVTWGGTEYMCLEFRIRVRRQITQTYTA